MKISRLIFAAVLAGATASAFAATTEGTASNNEQTTMTKPSHWYQASPTLLQEQARLAQLERHGFPQYSD